MRKAAGIILIIVGVVLLVGMIIGVIALLAVPSFTSAILPVVLGIAWPRIVFCGLVVAGGVLCLKRRHWGVCLVSALIPLCFWIEPAAATLAGAEYSIMWDGWIVVAGTLISTILITQTRKEWQEFADSADYEVSNGG
jgi:hypothetical protein